MVDILVRPDQRTDAVGIGGTPRARAWTLTVACMGVGLVVGSMTALNTALGDLAVATSATQTQLTWMVDGYTVALACLLLPAGAIGDRYGRRGALLTGLAIFSVGSIAPALLHAPAQIIAGRALAGVGAAFVMPATLSILTVAYPKEKRLKAVGIWAGTAGSGGVIGMIGSGLLLRFWDWHASSGPRWVSSGWRSSPWRARCASSRDNDAPRVDWLGAVLIGAAVGDSCSPRSWKRRVVGGCHPMVWGGHGRRARYLPSVFGVRRNAAAPTLSGRSAVRRAQFRHRDRHRSSSCSARHSASFIVGMQYVQQIMGYSPLIKTAVCFESVHGATVAFSRHCRSGMCPKLGCGWWLFIGTLLMAVGLRLHGRAADLHSTYLEFSWPTLILRHRHRNMHGTNNFGDHGCGSRREAGRGLRGERHVARDGRRRWVSPWRVRSWPGDIPTSSHRS